MRPLREEGVVGEEDLLHEEEARGYRVLRSRGSITDPGRWRCRSMSRMMLPRRRQCGSFCSSYVTLYTHVEILTDDIQSDQIQHSRLSPRNGTALIAFRARFRAEMFVNAVAKAGGRDSTWP